MCVGGDASDMKASPLAHDSMGRLWLGYIEIDRLLDRCRDA